jgi:hypothetical protein
MNLFRKLHDKLFLKQWNVGVIKGDIAEMIRSKKFNYEVKWLQLSDKKQFFADPFIVHANKDGSLLILVEDFTDEDGYGKISVIERRPDNAYDISIALDTKDHLSYPQVFEHEGRIFVIPESASAHKVDCYEFDPATKKISFVQNLVDFPLVDATMLKYHGKYWLFGTLPKPEDLTSLVIYYADNLFGPYKPHSRNTVKYSISGTRPAGAFFEVDGNLYRPAQNCSEYYGKTIVINKVEKLDEHEYSESFFMEIRPEKLQDYNYCVHTLNAKNGFIIIDGLKRHFMPAYKLGSFIRKLST